MFQYSCIAGNSVKKSMRLVFRLLRFGFTGGLILAAGPVSNPRRIRALAFDFLVSIMHLSRLIGYSIPLHAGAEPGFD